MQKRTNQKDTQEEIIMTLPATALEALGTGLTGQATNGHDIAKGDVYMGASPVGRDEPFPCFKKSAWDDQVVVKIVQQRQLPSAA